MIYQCQKCQKYFDHKTKYTKHLERKKDCITNDYVTKENIVTICGEVEVNNEDGKYCCLICNKKFSFSQSFSTKSKPSHLSALWTNFHSTSGFAIEAIFIHSPCVKSFNVLIVNKLTGYNKQYKTVARNCIYI